jgi:hypothetical protein
VQGVCHPYGEGLPIVLISAGTPAGQAGRIGAIARLDKPFDVDRLLAAVWIGLDRLGVIR